MSFRDRQPASAFVSEHTVDFLAPLTHIPHEVGQIELERVYEVVLFERRHVARVEFPPMLQNLSFAGKLVVADGAEKVLQVFVNGGTEEVERKVFVTQVEELSGEK